MKVNFMIIGAMKSGTTSLSFHLSRHPEVCFCIDKEPDYFSRNENWKEGISGYHSLFKPKPGQILGEASTMYTMRPDYMNTEQRIFEYNPEVKLIYIMRDPVDRIISHYAHNLARKRVGTDPEKEVFSRKSYIKRSLYHYQIEPYLQRFQRESLLLLTFEEFIKDPQKTLVTVSEFLGINAAFYRDQENFETKNQSTNRKILADNHLGVLLKPIKKYGHRYLPASVKEVLLQVFGNKLDAVPEFDEQLKVRLYKELAEDVQAVEKLLGKNLTEWKNYSESYVQ